MGSDAVSQGGATAVDGWVFAPCRGIQLQFLGSPRLLALLQRRFAAWPQLPSAADVWFRVQLTDADPDEASGPASDRIGLPESSGLPEIGLAGGRLSLRGLGILIDADLEAGGVEAAVGGAQAAANLDYLARVLTALLLDRAGGFLLHGAGLVRAGRGLLLLGPSGTGKTTAARNAAGAQVLNDDLVAVLPGVDGAWQLHATPFSNPTQVPPAPGQADLAGILRLRQALASAPAVEPLSPGLAVAELVAAVPVLVADAGRLPELGARLSRLAAVTPCAILRLGPRPDYWPVVETWLSGS